MQKQKVQELVELITQKLVERGDIEAVIWCGSSYFLPEGENYNPHDIDIIVITDASEDLPSWLWGIEEVRKKVQEVGLTVDITQRRLGWLRGIVNPLILALFTKGHKVMYANEKVKKTLVWVKKAWNKVKDRVKFIQWGIRGKDLNKHYDLPVWKELRI